MTHSLVSFLSRTEVWIAGLSMAAFLVLFWTLRGAPIGQGVSGEGEEAPRSGYRDRVIASVVLGLILVMAGAYVAMSGHVLWSLPAFAVGFGIVIALVAVNRRYRHGSPALRRTIELSDAILHASLLAGVLIVVNVIAFRYGGRALDLTQERAFSLSSLTLNQLKTLDRPVAFTVFFGRSDIAVRQLVRVQQLLELYKAANPGKITIEYINPFTEVEKFREIVSQVPDIGVVINQQGGGVLVEYGEGKSAERVVIRSDELFELPRGNRRPTAQFESKFTGEDAVTSALIRLRQGQKPKIAFTTGHGETPATSTDPRLPANNLWRVRLQGVGCEVVDVDLGQHDLSKEYALVVVDAPKEPFKPHELLKLKSYVDGGGPALILLGQGNARSGLDDLLKSYNIEIGEGMAIDPQMSQRYRLPLEALLVGVSPQPDHPIIQSLASRAVVVPFAAPLKLRAPGPGGKDVNPAINPVEILKTRRQAWAETDPESIRGKHPELDPKKDTPGPITVGIAASDRAKPGETEGGKPRLVVFSSGSMGNDQSINTFPTNEDVLMNSVSWLRGRPEMLGIEPKTHVSLSLSVDPMLRGRLILVPTVMALLLIIGLGLSTYVARRV